MTTVDFITELFCRVDEALGDLPKHPQAKLYPSEVVTMALLFALKGGGERAFYRWLARMATGRSSAWRWPRPASTSWTTGRTR